MGQLMQKNTRPQRVLFISDGHGEDDISCKILDALVDLTPENLEIRAWPQVGHGNAYQKRGIPIVGPKQVLPSEGFGTLNLKLFVRDLYSGFLPTTLGQIGYARKLRGQYDLLVGVGDIVPLAVGPLSKTPMSFVSCAKSAYYGRVGKHTRRERAYMRENCLSVFPRDQLTSETLKECKVPNTYVGNPMMDGLETTNLDQIKGQGNTNIAVFPGSRSDATQNARTLVRAAQKASELAEQPEDLRFLFAAHGAVDLDGIRGNLSGSWKSSNWDQGLSDDARYLCAENPLGTKILIIKERFSDILHCSDLAIGMAGTANEQAIGFGIPLITVPGAGNQGDSFVKMKMRYFGDAAVEASPDETQIANLVIALLNDKDRCARMAAAGRERMGEPGASAAIASAILRHLSSIAEDEGIT